MLPLFSLSLLTFLLAIIVVACGVLGAPPYPCTYTNENGVRYDLSNMYRDPAYNQQDFSFAANDGSIFYVNVCGQTAKTVCNPANGVCQITSGGVGYGDGDASTAKWQNLNNNANGVQITLSNGSGGLCNGLPRTSYLQISCDIAQGDGTIDSVTESTAVPCQYTIVMRSKWACGSASSDTNPLMSLFNSTNGAQWFNKRNWGYGNPCSNLWYGVQCSGPFVTALNLDNNNLVGSIPGSLSGANNLNSISMFGNELTGTIPSSLSTLSLNTLVLNNNRLQSPLPSFLSSQPKIQNIDLRYNNFTCPLPSWCDSYPTGNGLCTPCNSANNSTYFCCIYENNSNRAKSAICADTSNCPALVGASQIGAVKLINECGCKQCFEAIRNT